MLTYFRDLLATLKLIEAHLAFLRQCVKHSGNRYGDSFSLSVRHWNDS